MSHLKNSSKPFKQLKAKSAKSPKNGTEFLDAIKKVQEDGEVTKRTKEWIKKVEHITEKDLKFIVQ